MTNHTIKADGIVDLKRFRRVKEYLAQRKQRKEYDNRMLEGALKLAVEDTAHPFRDDMVRVLTSAINELNS